MRHLLRLSWLEIKIFLREPLGAIGTLLVPVAIFVVLGGLGRTPGGAPPPLGRDLPIIITLLVAISGVTSLTGIIAIYRDGGILKRLRATPLTPLAILTSHVAVKMFFTAVTLALLALVGRRFYSGPPPANPAGFLTAVVLVMASILSIGFVLASVAPTARFAQPLASTVLLPLFGLSGVFFPLDALPGIWQTVARASPLAQAVMLLRGTWAGEPWGDQGLAIVALLSNFAFCTMLSKRIFRWE